MQFDADTIKLILNIINTRDSLRMYKMQGLSGKKYENNILKEEQKIKNMVNLLTEEQQSFLNWTSDNCIY